MFIVTRLPANILFVFRPALWRYKKNFKRAASPKSHSGFESGKSGAKNKEKERGWLAFYKYATPMEFSSSYEPDPYLFRFCRRTVRGVSAKPHAVRPALCWERRQYVPVRPWSGRFFCESPT